MEPWAQGAGALGREAWGAAVCLGSGVGGVPVRACFWPAVKVVVCGLEKER